MKRPWDPHKADSGRMLYSPEEWDSKKTLEAKAPEMAELLVELTEIATSSDFSSSGYTRLVDLYDKAKQLLKEVGYEPETD